MIIAEFVRDARLQAIADAIDAAGAAGRLRFYPAPRVGGPAIAPGVPLLLDAAFQRPSSAGAAGGVLVFDPLDEALVSANGTAAWARITDSDGVGIMDLDVGLVDSGAEVELDNVVMAIGAAVRIDIASLTEP